MNPSDSTVFDYDPFAKAVMENPLPFYKKLRESFPAYYIQKYDTFVFSRFQDIVDLMSMQDNAFLSTEATLPTPDYLAQHHNASGAPPVPSPAAPMTSLSGGALGYPYYEDLRHAHIKPLRPKSVQAIEDFIRKLANERLDILLPQGEFDLTREYGGVIAATVICRFFGMPLEMAGQVLALVNSMTVTDPDKGGVDVPSISRGLIGTIIPWVRKRREAGADGSLPLIDGMIHYRVDGNGRFLGDAEIAEQLICVFVGGTETVPKINAHGLLELSQHPDQLAAIRDDLSANVPKAVEEIIRFCAPAQWFARTAHKDVVVAGQSIKAGQRVMALFGSAARDEREFENPDGFIWNRKIERVLSFGFGQHYCIGVHVARAELRILIEEFLKRVPSFHFDMTQAVRYPSSFQWGWNSLRVVVN